MAESFVFYKSFIDAVEIDGLSETDQLQILKSIIHYALNGEEPDNSTSITTRLAFTLIKPQIDANTVRRENGSKGGRPKKTKTNGFENKTNGFENETVGYGSFENEKPNVNVNDNVNANANDNVNVNENDNILHTPKKQTFSDEIQQIVDYLNAKCNTNYRTTTEKTRKFIIARLKEKFTVDDFKIVIDKKSAEWLSNAEMVKFLRPETLFGTKFENYLNQQVAQPKLAPNEMARKTDPWAI